MKNLSILSLFLVLFISLTFTGCAVVGDIFEAGVWTVLIGVVIIVAVVIWILKKIF